MTQQFHSGAFIPEKNEILDSHKYLCMNVYSSLIYKTPKPKQNKKKMFFKGFMVIQTVLNQTNDY